MTTNTNMPNSGVDVDALLKPAFEALKEEARAAIKSAEDEMRNRLHVLYDAGPDRLPEGLPAPRLQLRWAQEECEGYDRVCYYEMVFSLREFDVRNDSKAGFAVIELGKSMQGGGSEPWTRTPPRARRPFRDGAHADWDSVVFGGLPIFVISPNGEAVEIDPENEATREEAGR
jgi:hypothetical protein